MLRAILKGVAVIYLSASLLISVAYNAEGHSWSIANNRNGLLCVGIDEEGWWILSPFCNYCDVFLFGINADGSMFSDGLYCFGKFE